MSSVTPTRASLDRFIRSLKNPGLTLDLGCGSGRYESFFPTRVGLDLNGRPGIHVRGDAHSLPFKDESFDAVLCTELLEHTFEPWRAIKEIERVLRSGGRCILTTRFLYPIHGSPNDFYRFTEFALRRLFLGWELLYIEPDTDLISSVMVILYGSGGAGRSALGRLFWLLCWRPIWKLYFRLYPRLRGIRPSRLGPTGYHLIARKAS